MQIVDTFNARCTGAETEQTPLKLVDKFKNPKFNNSNGTTKSTKIFLRT